MKNRMLAEWYRLPVKMFNFYDGLFEKHINRSSVLIIGTGFDEAQYYFWPTVLESYGAKSVEYLEVCKAYCDRWAGKEYPVKLGNVLNIRAIYSPGDFDVVLWLHGPEHIERQFMETCFWDIYNIANKLVLFACPYGGYYDYQETCNGNDNERHVQKNMTPDLFKDMPEFSCTTIGEKDKPDGNIMIWKTK